MRHFWLIILALWVWVGDSLAAPLIASLDSHVVKISIDFTGNEILLFGSAEEEGEIIVIVQGPRRTLTVRKKRRSYGIWHNAENVSFDNVPGYYALSYSGSRLPRLSKGTLRRHEIGGDNLNLKIRGGEAYDASKLAEFRASLLEQLGLARIFSVNAVPLERLGEHLFRTSFFIPANAPVGTYRAEVFLVRNRKIISAQATPLFVSKTGIEAQVYNMAHRHSAFYGVMAVVLAIVAGYTANAVMRKK